MELVFLLFCLGAGASLKSAWDHASADRGKGGDAKVKAAKKAAGGTLPDARARQIKRRHARGWWLREVAGGFPVARTGWHAGWLAHSTESRHQRHIREEARTSDLEAKVAYGPAMQDHKRRQKALRDEILRVYDDTSPKPGQPVREAVREAAGAVVLHPDFPRPAAGEQPLAPTGTDGDHPDVIRAGHPEDGLAYTVRRDGDNYRWLTASRDEALAKAEEWSRSGDEYHVGHADGAGGEEPVASYRGGVRSDDSDHLRPGQKRCPQCGGSGGAPGGGACSYCRGWGSDDPDPNAPAAAPGTICGACGHPGTDADPVLTEGGESFHRSHALAAAANRPADDWPAGIPHRRRGDASPATEGNAMPTGTAETTYDQTITEANGIISDCEEEIQEARKTIAARDAELVRLKARRMLQKIENLASAGLDSGSMSRAMEIDEALRAQERAAQDAIDAAQASEKAASQALDSAQAFRDGLQRDHGGMNEAHQNAPVVGAQPEFYAG
jgi:hypothetical protein